MDNVKLEYLGYSIDKLEAFDDSVLDNVSIIYRDLDSSKKYKLEKAYSKISSLSGISLQQVKDGADAFYNKHFKVGSINKLTIYEATDILSKVNAGKVSNITQTVNQNLSIIKPTDLDIELIDGHAMIGTTIKPILVSPGMENDPNRKVYFSNIELGKKLNKLSIVTYIHELAHTLSEKNIGYASDYYLKEVISIFLEKVAAYELDPSLELLSISENARTRYMFDSYRDLSNNKLDNTVYVKSTLLATKLFDNYMNEENEDDKLTYMSDIQDVFDGKLKVDRMLRNRGITLENSMDSELVKKHIK